MKFQVGESGDSSRMSSIHSRLKRQNSLQHSPTCRGDRTGPDFRSLFTNRRSLSAPHLLATSTRTHPYGEQRIYPADAPDSGPRIVEWGSHCTRTHYLPGGSKHLADYKDITCVAPWTEVGFQADVTPSEISCRFCRGPMEQQPKQHDEFYSFDPTSDQSWNRYQKPHVNDCIALFHEECSNCASYEEAKSPDLCDFCSHLRLGHLLRCTPEFFSIVVQFPKDLLSVDELECSFCRLMAETVQSVSRSKYRNIIRLMRLPQENADRDTEKCLLGGIYRENLCRGCSTIFAQDSEPKIGKKIRTAALRTCPPKLMAEEEWIIIKNWLRECLSEHECSLSQHAHRRPVSLRFVDVWRRCLVEASPSDTFVALSYVWGEQRKPSWLKAMQSNIYHLGKENSLDSKCLPQTIEDAIQVCRRIGENYLWVDQLCIVQDDPENMQHQIDRMASIFSSAKLVIVDAHGENMDHGLTGVSKERTALPSTTTIAGLAFDALHLDRIWTVLESCWASRGWTFQEAALARRKLYFTKSQVSFECTRHTRHESVFTERFWATTRKYESVGLADKTRIQGGDFDFHLLEYRERTLSHESDACNAFAGVLDALYGIEECSYGLPHPCFDQALLWYPTQLRYSVTREEYIQTHQSNVVFPSWSWSCLTGATRLFDSTTYCGSLVAWAHFSCGKFQPICSWSPLALSENWTIGMGVALNYGCITSPKPMIPLDKTEPEGWIGQLRHRWRSYKCFWDDAFGTQASSAAEHLDANCDINTSDLHRGMVFGRAQCAVFGLSFGEFRDFEKTFSITNSRHQSVGSLLATDPRVKLEASRCMAHAGAKFTFIGLSIYDIAIHMVLDNVFAWAGNHIGKEEPMDEKEASWPDSTEAIPTRFQVAVMLIGERRGLAHRIGIGFINMKDWIEARPSFQDIVLE